MALTSTYIDTQLLAELIETAPPPGLKKNLLFAERYGSKPSAAIPAEPETLPPYNDADIKFCTDIIARSQPKEHHMPDPTTLTVTFGSDSAGRYVATIADSDDMILGGRGDTEQAAVERAVSVYFSVRNQAISNPFTAAPRTKRVAVAEPTIRRLIEDAIRTDSTLQITYEDSKGISTEREIEPHRFVAGAFGGENVESWDHLRGGTRMFNLSRIKRAEEV